MFTSQDLKIIIFFKKTGRIKKQDLIFLLKDDQYSYKNLQIKLRKG